jgi:hypothetical protein
MPGRDSSWLNRSSTLAALVGGAAVLDRRFVLNLRNG